MFLPGYGPIAIADWSIIGQTWVLASIGAVVEMGVLSTLKRRHCFMESRLAVAYLHQSVITKTGSSLFPIPYSSFSRGAKLLKCAKIRVGLARNDILLQHAFLDMLFLSNDT
jgi:hypothetical protein